MALAVRQAAQGVAFEMAKAARIPDWQDAGVRGHAQHAKSPIYIASVASTRIDEMAAATRHGDAIDLARAGFGIAHAIDPDSPPGTLDAFVTSVAEALSAAERPLVIAGSEAREPGLGPRCRDQYRLALGAKGKDAMLALTASESNSYGVALLGGSLSLSDALVRIGNGAVPVIVENDLHRRVRADGVDIDRAIVLDYLETPTVESAAVVLPASTYAEQTGTFVNYETRAQRFYQVFEPTDEVAPSWRWISAIAKRHGRNDLNWANMDALTKACAAANDELAGLAEVAPGAGFRVAADSKIPRQPHRYSGRTAMRAQLSVHEPKATVDDETPFSYSMEGQNNGSQPGALVPYVWTPGWNSNQSVFKFQQEVGGALNGGDPGVRLIADAPPSEDPAPFEIRSREPTTADAEGSTFQVARLSSVFGGDELSAASAPVLERTPAPFAVLNPVDAKRLGVEAGGGVRIEELDTSVEVRLDEAVQPGVAGILQGVPGAGLLTTAQVELAADADFVRRPSGPPDLIARG